MNDTTQLGWYGLSRKGIPGVMLGVERPDGQQERSPELHMSSLGADLAVGFESLNPWQPPRERQTPVLVVVDGNKISDLLSWIHTFSRETFPLSQYCRVLTVDDWRLSTDESSQDGSVDLSCWASIVAGEMLGQGEQVSSIAATPLSWAHGCLSFAMTRTMLLYGERNERATTQAAERLSACERNPKFQRRRIEQFALQPIWALASSGQRFDGDGPGDVAYSVVDAVSPELGSTLRASQLVRSSSAEQRVIGFEEVAKVAMGQVAVGGLHRRMGSAMLAAAAFLAGNGTSHVGLLEAHAKRCPETYAWFGLLGGLAGPSAWDASWMRLTKGVQRLVGASHRLTDLPQADLSWVEHVWLSGLSEESDVYTSVPRLSQRLLAVEVLPGVSCQFRISGGSAVEVVPRSQGTEGTSYAAPEGIHRALKIAAELQAVLVEMAGTPGQPARQQQLFGSTPPAPKRRAAARTKPKT